ncbi:MAG: protoheme IX farnesyltransferase, partial [Candidatus Saccharimonadales bacterium]
MTIPLNRTAFSGTLKRYYVLTKPGIIRGNVIIVIAGYLFGAAGSPSWKTLLGLVVGSSLIIASACVYNNILDRNIDKQMSRTKNRALVENTISVLNAAIFGTVLLVLATLVLFFTTNILALVIALIGHVAYVVLYTFTKRVTVHGTLLGTISGSTPPVIGYVTATGALDSTALL